MTVKILNQAQKDRLIARYLQGGVTQKTLAVSFETSQRTINRVLVEAGLLTAVPRIQAEAYTVMQVLKKHHIEGHELDAMLTNIAKEAREPKTPSQWQVMDYLMGLTDQEVQSLFYDASMHKFEMQLETVMAESSMATQYLEAMDEGLPF